MGTNEDRPFSHEANTDENEPEQPQTPTEGTGHVAVRNLDTQQRRRKAVGCLLQVFALQLTLFGLLAWFVHFHPIVPLDVAITHAFQQNQAPWLRIAMLAISYPGSSPLLPVLVLLTTVVFWAIGVRLEALFVAGLSAVSLLLNLLIKVLVGRPRSTGHLVHIIQTAIGYSFPSGHVMAYIAYWGLLFCFGVILLQGRHWWRTVLLVISASFAVLIGPSRIYLGAHWASDVLGAYLIGGVLLGLTIAVYLPLKERGVLQTPGGTRTHEAREGIALISDKRMVLNSSTYLCVVAVWYRWNNEHPEQFPPEELPTQQEAKVSGLP